MEAAHANRSGELYKITNKICGKTKKQVGAIRDKNGSLLTNEKDIINRLKEHFEEVLNQNLKDPASSVFDEIKENEALHEINCGPFTFNEVKRAIKGLKNNKSPGVDNITSELLKADIDTAARQLLNIFEQVKHSKTIPSDWKKSYLVKIPKKGDLTRCDNYRGISLLSIPGKVLSRIIIDRVRDGVDAVLRRTSSI